MTIKLENNLMQQIYRYLQCVMTTLITVQEVLLKAFINGKNKCYCYLLCLYMLLLLL